MPQRRAPDAGRSPLYTSEQRARRDATRWTLVQGVLAPLQFLIFLLSLALVVRFLATGEGFWAATVSILAKTLALYAIMVTGSIWEKAVFGRWLFAPAFFWEDVVSMGVIALHTAYLAALFSGADPHVQVAIALAAYSAYVVNAAQFLLKLRAARKDGSSLLPHARAPQEEPQLDGRRAGAFSPPPCGDGSGVGMVQDQAPSAPSLDAERPSPILRHPHPYPPHKGEGASPSRLAAEAAS